MASLYTAHQPDEAGTIHYSDEEHGTWQILIARQLAALEGKACDEYQAGLARLDLPRDRIPSWPRSTPCCNRPPAGRWRRCRRSSPLTAFCPAGQSPVSGSHLHSPSRRARLPAGARHLSRIFGHCAMLTNPAFAHFTHVYGQLGLRAGKEERVFLARLYWFTVEFGLLATADGLRIYGGGILFHRRDRLCPRRPTRAATLDPIEVLRTPYRIDIMQPTYFVLPELGELYRLAEQDIMAMVAEARRLGLRPRFAPVGGKQAS